MATAPPLYERFCEENLDAVRRSQNGSRNATLNRSAFATAQLAKAGRLNVDEEKRRLIEAGKAAGLGEHEAKATVDSAWRAGESEPRSIGNDNGPREPERYLYRDADGQVRYAKARVDLPEQKYQYQHYDGQRWKAGRGGGNPIPYLLPTLAKAPPEAVLYMAEGEKHADKLARWGFISTSHKDWKRDFAPYVTGRTVIILPDNDEDGAQQAEKAARLVREAGGTPHLLNLPDLPPKGDIMDWKGTAEDLRALANALLNPPEQLLPLADLAAWSSTVPTPKEFWVERIVPRNEVVIWTGDGGTNKSTGALQLCACSAAGKQFLGLDVVPGPALYVTAEDDDRENHWRLAKICSAIGTSLEGITGRLFVSSLRGRLNNELATFDNAGRLQPTASFAALRSTIQRTGVKLIALDNVAHLFAGNENDRSQVTAFVNLLYQLCGDLGVTILLIAHRNKAGDSYSGSTAWLNAVRSQIVMERPDGIDPDARTLTLGKANYARQNEALTGLRWHDFALIRDGDMPADQRAEMAANLMASADNDTFLRCLRARNEQRRAVSEKVSPTFAPKVFADMAEASGTSKKRLEQAMDRLFRIGAIERAALWDGDDRHPVFGLRETAKNGGNPCGRHTEANVRETAGNHTRETAANTYTPPKGGNGAATWAAAPSTSAKSETDF